jgi:hypothetical protein
MRRPPYAFILNLAIAGFKLKKMDEESANNKLNMQ